MIDYTSPRQPRTTPFDIDTPAPAPPPEVMGPAQQPIGNNIRGLIQRLRGQVPHQVAPAPQPPAQPQPQSVLRR
jgi:hypothetical protein